VFSQHNQSIQHGKQINTTVAHPHVIVKLLIILNKRLEAGAVRQHVIAHSLPYQLVVASGTLYSVHNRCRFPVNRAMLQSR